MPEPFVFHFKPGPDGRTEAMYMLDLDCRCELCRHEQFQRFYHSTPLHELTVPGLERLADGAALKAGYECENCGTAVGANQVRHTRLAFGFADDAGVIRIFDDLESGDRTFELTPRRRLDPQAVPRWSPDPEAHGDGHRVVDHLDEAVVEEVLGRPFNLKLAWRDLLTAHIDQTNAARATRLAPDIWIAVAADRHKAQRRLDALDDENLDRARETDALTTVDLADSTPDELPTRGPDELGGTWRRWLPERVVEALDDETLTALAAVSTAPIVETVERTFEVARLDWTFGGDEPAFTDLTTPTDTTYDRPVPVDAIARRAVHTGLGPGEAARLTAEEIVGTLMQVW